ncbi:DUF3427 domain-containing protein [Nesterenkonia marinintestina]|uniref:DUF3427 domain-containing protein n=1 Tax=Nesterenkonia marinintestina TaxID=2979865 RepID=UPI0021BE886C|nr:DUF3427 domain-containing protein [Nesterenkonia sp. GX14115]
MTESVSSPDLSFFFGGNYSTREPLPGFARVPKHYAPRVVTNRADDHVLRILRQELKHASSFVFSVAFVSPEGIAVLKEDLVQYQGDGCIITSDYLNFNNPEAFWELLNLSHIGINVRIHSSSSFHPKGYIFDHPHQVVTAMMGSSNLTKYAITRNHEWNLKVSVGSEGDLGRQIWNARREEYRLSEPLTAEWITQYEKRYVPPQWGQTSRKHVSAALSALADVNIIPNRMQSEALEAIAKVRELGERKAVVVSATGTGKTILSALDVQQFAPARMLFLAHREQILDKSVESYRAVLQEPQEAFGKRVGSHDDSGSKYLFSTMQTMSQDRVLSTYRPDEFDYILIDEAHRTGAASYQKILDYFTPAFLLGMTATPERGDGFNVFEQFDFNVPYEIRLHDALEAEMLAPFHYYGIADATFEDGVVRAVDESTQLQGLVSPERVEHLLQALRTYGQAGVPPRGLIFCSRVDEARGISSAMNNSTLAGRPLRTAVVSGSDSPEVRERRVAELEAGQLHYLLTVDIFNEGVDIPTVNQVVMLRQTQSSIVFVQQLGRGLRLASGKEYLVVIDFIGNYANNYMIPVALFGDNSLNKESLRKNLVIAEEVGVISGLSSVRFDRIAHSRVLDSIATTKLDHMKTLKEALQDMYHRVGQVPHLWDFYRFRSADPIVLATKSVNGRHNYLALSDKLLGIERPISQAADRALSLLCHEVLPSKRLHEFLIIEALLETNELTHDDLIQRFNSADIFSTTAVLESAISTFTLGRSTQNDQLKFGPGIVEVSESHVSLTAEFREAIRSEVVFAEAVNDVIRTGKALTIDRYDNTSTFTVGRQYSRKDALRLLGLDPKSASTVYGYKVYREQQVCPIFVTLHKDDSVEASVAYEDQLIDTTHMRWYTRSRRTLASDEVQAITNNDVRLFVFVKKDDSEGSDFYFLGDATCEYAEQATMSDKNGRPLNVVRTRLVFSSPIEQSLYDYFHPVLAEVGDDQGVPAYEDAD